ncbi:MAG: hypothetical protein SFW67_33435 [Myxococcaceae bacterium]|nr:hypothetical protein [Myxococcaceae bacterium]
MERFVIDSSDESLGLAFFVLGIRGPVAASATFRLIQVEHQYGGYACAHEDVTGVIFRLHEARSRKDLRPLLGGIGAISEQGAPPDYPVDHRLEAFGYTSGEPLEPRAVSDVFMDYLPIPAFSRAWEAFAERVPVEPSVMGGWTAWEPDGLCAMNDELLDQLVAAAAISRQPLGLYLLWANSD